MKTSNSRRRAVSLVEVLLGLVILMVAMGAAMQLSVQSSRGTRWSGSLLLAELALTELEAAHGGRTPAHYVTRGFPSSDTGWTGLHDSRLADHRLLDPGDGELATALQARRAAMELTRRVYFEALVPRHPSRGGRVSLRVGYRGQDGRPRELRRDQVVR
jgi:hypothetical protein